MRIIFIYTQADIDIHARLEDDKPRGLCRDCRDCRDCRQWLVNATRFALWWSNSSNMAIETPLSMINVLQKIGKTSNYEWRNVVNEFSIAMLDIDGWVFQDSRELFVKIHQGSAPEKPWDGGENCWELSSDFRLTAGDGLDMAGCLKNSSVFICFQYGGFPIM